MTFSPNLSRGKAASSRFASFDSVQGRTAAAKCNPSVCSTRLVQATMNDEYCGLFPHGTIRKCHKMECMVACWFYSQRWSLWYRIGCTTGSLVTLALAACRHKKVHTSFPLHQSSRGTGSSQLQVTTDSIHNNRKEERLVVVVAFNDLPVSTTVPTKDRTAGPPPSILTSQKPTT